MEQRGLNTPDIQIELLDFILKEFLFTLRLRPLLLKLSKHFGG